jgi:dTDP-glucose 4,6-dehydratase
MRVLLTGGAGFIGHHVAHTLLTTTDAEVTFLDRLQFAGNMNRIAQLPGFDSWRHRCRWVYHDLRSPISGQLEKQIGCHDWVLHLAAMTHVDRSIGDPLGAALDNVVGTVNILDHARRVGCDRFLYFSTDEVFGPAPGDTSYREWDRYNSGNPYAAGKAGGEEFALAFRNTYGLPVIVTHTMNVFGPRQHPEKFIPSTIRKVRDGETVTVHANKERTKAGSRFYIAASNVGAALLFLLKHGENGQKYNIVGEREVCNMTLARMIAEHVGQPLKAEMVDFHSSRPGHDLRYGLDGSKLAGMGYVHPVNFEQSLQDTVRWFLAHPDWL